MIFELQERRESGVQKKLKFRQILSNLFFFKFLVKFLQVLNEFFQV